MVFSSPNPDPDPGSNLQINLHITPDLAGQAGWYNIWNSPPNRDHSQTLCYYYDIPRWISDSVILACLIIIFLWGILTLFAVYMMIHHRRRIKAPPTEKSSTGEPERYRLTMGAERNLWSAYAWCPIVHYTSKECPLVLLVHIYNIWQYQMMTETLMWGPFWHPAKSCSNLYHTPGADPVLDEAEEMHLRGTGGFQDPGFWTLLW